MERTLERPQRRIVRAPSEVAKNTSDVSTTMSAAREQPADTGVPPKTSRSDEHQPIVSWNSHGTAPLDHSDMYTD
jgi:hypothetical protein